jgi:hypothetical protein
VWLALLATDVAAISFHGGQTDTESAEHAPWHPVSRVAFRFCFTYLKLFCLVLAQITFRSQGDLRAAASEAGSVCGRRCRSIRSSWPEP